MASIKQDALWSFAASLVGTLSQILLMVLLARHLDQASLGIFALLSIMLLLLGYLQDLGLSTFAVQYQNLQPNDRTNLHLLSITLGAVATALCLLSAPLAGWLYQSAVLTSLLTLLAPQLLLLGASTQYHAEMLREGKLAKLAQIDILSKIVAFALTLYLLLSFPPALDALVYGQLTGAFLRLLLLWLATKTPIHWRCTLDFPLWRAALRFGLFQSGAQVIGFLRNRVDQLIIGKLLGLEALGLYSLAKDIIQQPPRLLNPVIQRVLLPRFSRRTDATELFQQSLRLNLQLNTVVYAGLALISSPLVLWLFGGSYQQAAVLLCIFALYGMIKPSGMVLSTYCQSMGRSDVEFYWNLWASLVMVSLVSLSAALSNLYWVALVLSAVQFVLSCYAQHYFSQRGAAPKSGNLCRQAAPYVLLTLAASSAGIMLNPAVLF